MRRLRDIPLVDAAVPADGLFLAAARALLAGELPAIEVLDAERRVVGLFTAGDLLRGLVPGYFVQLRDTALLPDDAAPRREAAAAAELPVRRYTRPAATVEIDTSVLHAFEFSLQLRAGGAGGGGRRAVRRHAERGRALPRPPRGGRRPPTAGTARRCSRRARRVRLLAESSG